MRVSAIIFLYPVFLVYIIRFVDQTCPNIIYAVLLLFKCTATIPLSFFLLRVRSRLTR
nr:MAG TPA: hypothetical protein [Caudoviricetes sp.]